MMLCRGPAYDPETWDVSLCVQSALVLVPTVVLALCALYDWRNFGLETKRPQHGKGAYTLKMLALGALTLVQLSEVILVVHDRTRLAFAIVALVAYACATALEGVSHPSLRHASTPLLFWSLLSILLALLAVRSVLITGRSPAFTAVVSTRLALLCVFFGLELLGPQGWTSWRDYTPFVEARGKIKLPEEGEVDWEQRECPRLTANIFQRLTFSWMTPMMKAGYRHFLTEEDLWELPPGDSAYSLGQRLETAWEARRWRAAQPSLWQRITRQKVSPAPVTEQTGNKASLTGALFAAYGGPFFVAAIFKLGQDSLAFVQPWLLKRLLLWVSTYNTPEGSPASHGYIIALSMFLCAVTQTTLLHCYFSRVFETGMRVRAGLISLIYKKALVMSPSDRGDRLTGDIVNLQSTDATRLQDLCTYGQIAWSGIWQITLAFISLYSLMGWPMFVGVVVMLASIPVTGGIARVQTKLQQKQMKNKDERTSIMSEILSNIRSIKLYAWENSFAQRLFEVRNNKELAMLRKMGFLKAGSSFLWSFTPFAVSFSSFAVYVAVSDTPLTSEIVFPALTLFQLLGFPLAIMPVVFSSLVEAYVSIDRLSNFLTVKELQSDAVTIEPHAGDLQVGDELVSVISGSFAWTQTGHINLQNISLAVKKGDLIAVVGKLAAGKTSLLSAVLGEMTKVEGQVTVKGTVAYCAQQPWILGGTVRENITFGHRYEQDFYELVIEACALKEDLKLLPHGDSTEVGEKGISLSGGQKARIALARAVYARADIYLLDDPLSAVDAHVGRHLFDRVIGPSGILKTKARLLTTNAIPYCEQADELIMLRDGSILEKTSYAEAVQGNSDLSRLLIEFGKSSGSDDDDGNSSDETTAVDGETAQQPVQNEEDLDAEDLAVKLKLSKCAQAITRPAEPIPVDEQKRNTLRALKQSTKPKEGRQQGSVKLSVYKEYIQANGYAGVFLFIFTIVAQQLLQILTNVWLKDWSNHNSAAGNNGNIAFYLGIYAALGIGAALVYFLNGILLYSLCVIRAARHMHDRMFAAVMRSPMLFFELTPQGVVLNRFSRDIFVIDEVLARVFGDFWRTLASVGGMIVVICSSAPAFLIVLIPVLLVYKRIQTYYLATSRELKRLDATTKSPIFASFQETLGGLSTIRAYRQPSRFIAENEARIDRNQEAYFPSINCNRWLAVRLEFLGSILIVSTALLAVFTLVRTSNLNAGLVGLMLSYVLSTTQTLNWIVRSATEVETNIVSVERVVEYIGLPSEAAYEVPENEPPADWPQRGEIRFDHVKARYRDNLDPVLHDVNFEIKAGEKVGVCGRTGAGKSSLTMVLYRIIEAESGVVSIDGVDVRKLGLHDLRSRLSIIPQDSQAFAGSLRQNLDPTSTATDAQLWAALDQCRLKPHVEAMDGKLDAHIDEGGTNLSAGQRQLLCLGRALLRRSKILVLDEATAAVDVESDREIQAVIRREFADCTIFTIAHRLNTIMDCDRILVMSAGEVAEFDSPAKLLDKPDGIFRSMAVEAGLVKASGTNTPRSGGGGRTPRTGTMTPANK